jgi:nucleotide-binding universal stress UspA family protein
MKIVVAVDGSKYARWGIEWLARLPFATPPKVLGVHVVDIEALRAPFLAHAPALSIEPFVRAEIKRLQDRAKRVQTETQTLFRLVGIKDQVKVERGASASVILRHVAPGSLIVVGHRGLDAVDRFFLGSTSEKVIHHAPCSVLVVKQRPRPLRRILLATDGSRTSGKALQFLLRDLKPPDRSQIEVIVMHVMPLLQYPERRKPSKAMLTRYTEQLNAAGYDVRELAELGKAAEQIIKASERLKVDLVVAGAKGLGAVARFFLGSVSTKLVQHTPCSVLVVR